MLPPSVACKACRDADSQPLDFVMAFQPIVDLGAGRIWGYEALVRGANGEGAAAVLARVTDDNRYRFDQACRVKAIETAGRLFRDAETRLSINFMPNAVYEPAACIRASLMAAERAGFAHDRIMFEFTENEKMIDAAHVQRIIAEYKRLGFITAVDDFGAGHAGLGLLARFQPDVMKLDMDLIRDIDASVAKQTIVAGIVGIARGLGMAVLAEGVESDAEISVLRAAGIALFQGYRIARPVAAALPELNIALVETSRPRTAHG